MPQYLELVAARLDWQRLCAVLEELAQRDWLHVDAMPEGEPSRAPSRDATKDP